MRPIQRSRPRGTSGRPLSAVVAGIAALAASAAQTSSPQASGLDSFADIMSSGTSTLPGLARSRDAMQAR